MPMFVDTSPPGQCIFCRLVAGEIPAARVHEDELTLAFMDIGQVNPGHVLVAVKRHAATLLDLTEEEAAAAMRTARRVALAVREAFEATDTVVIESTDVIDQAAMMAALAAEPELTMFTDGTTLRSLIPADDLDMVEARLRERGMPLASVNRMKPWMLAAIVALPACELERKTRGEPILDLMLAADAQAAGKELAGLESVSDQLGAMASLPMDLHVEGLVETLRLGDRMGDVLETMIVLYRTERIGMFWPFFRAVLPSGADGRAGYAAFEETMVNARNRTMVRGAEPFLKNGGAFIAVGALHLPGPEGLVALLRAAGYEVTPEPL